MAFCNRTSPGVPGKTRKIQSCLMTYLKKSCQVNLRKYYLLKRFLVILLLLWVRRVREDTQAFKTLITIQGPGIQIVIGFIGPLKRAIGSKTY